jgi:hypothetical protein
MILYLGSSLAAVLAGVALVVTLLFGMRWSFADLGRGHG